VTRWPLLLAILAMLAGCGAIQTAGGTDGPEVPTQLQSHQIIVTLAKATPERWAAMRASLARAHGLDAVGAFPLDSLGVQCVVFQVPPGRSMDEALARLTADPLVESAQPNQLFRGLVVSHDDPYASMQYGARVIHAPLAHRWATGKGVSVAVVDTGVDTNHPDLRGRIARSASFVQGGEQTFGDDSHGTAVAGVIAAVAGNGIGIFGVAPEARILAAKACWHRRPEDLRAVCSSWTLAKAVDFAIGGDAQVLNLSLGGPPDALLARLIERAIERNIPVVAAVVDQGGPVPGFPASLDSVIAVVASDPDGAVRAPAALSRPGVLAAPGIDVLTTAPRGAYDFRSGSSLAAAHVSGVVALLLERDARLTPAQVRAILTETAAATSTVAGGGARVSRIDACAALARLVGAACQ
jgi:subtilisin family serine protease